MVSVADTNPTDYPATAMTRLEQKYYLTLLSMALVDLCLSGVFLMLSGKPSVIFLRLPEGLVFLVALNLAGGYWLFAPIRQFLASGEGRDEAIKRASKLGPLTLRWAVIVSILFTLSSFFVTPFLVFKVPQTPEVMAILVSRALTWVVLLPYVAGFVLQEYLRLLRRRIFEDQGILVPAGRASVGRKLALILLGGVVVPAVSIGITLLLVPEVSPITGQPRSVVIITTLIGASLALMLAFWATQRATTEGFRNLLRAMRKIENGDLGGQIVIETDDELGRLGEGFNALSCRLEKSQAETERKEAERARASAQFHEAQKRDALGRLSAGIAHDFNNVLAIITLYSDSVRERLPEGDKDRHRLQKVLIAADRGKDLISQILDFTRDKPRNFERLDVAEHVQEAVSLIEETVAKDVQISVSLGDRALPVDGDSTGIHQVIANLAINAIHAMEARGGQLRINLDAVSFSAEEVETLKETLAARDDSSFYSLEENGQAKAYLGLPKAKRYARVTIADNGSGMSLETLEHIFDPYFTTKPVGEGTGLGLAAVAGIVVAHGGGIAVETAVGVGTSFHVLLPIVSE